MTATCTWRSVDEHGAEWRCRAPTWPDRNGNGLMCAHHDRDRLVEACIRTGGDLRQLGPRPPEACGRGFPNPDPFLERVSR